MGFDLKKLLEDAVNGLNQATGSKNRISSTPPPPASTAQPVQQPQQQGNFIADTGKNLGNFFGSVGKVGQNVNDFSKTLTAGIQQGAGALGDVALQGGGLVGNLGAQTNPFINQKQRDAQANQQLQNTEQLRNALHSTKDVQGNNTVGTTDVDQNALNIAKGNGNLQDYAAVLGKGLDVANTATMFANPASLVKGAGIGDAVRTGIKDAGLFGTTGGLQGGLQTYGNTGDLGQAVKQGVTSGLVSGATQGALDVAAPIVGALTRKGVQVAGDTARPAVQATTKLVQESTPTAIAQKAVAQDPRVLGFDDQYATLAKQYDALPANSPQKRVVNQLMADNRTQRLKTAQGLQKNMLQGGYVKVPGSANEDDLITKVDQYAMGSEITDSEAARRMGVEKEYNAAINKRKSLSPNEKSSQQIPKVEQTTLQVPNSQVTSEAQNLLPEASLSPESLSSPKINTADYVKQQTKAQETARKQGDLSTAGKVKNEVRSKLIDSLAPIEDTLAKANKNGANIKISDANHITPQLDRVLRADTIAGQFAKDNGLHDIIQNVPDTKEFDQYLIAKHAADLEKNGIATGRNSAADAQLVQALAPKYEAHAQAINKYNQNLLDTAAGYGLISKDLASSLKKQYPNYVPANRIFSEGENTGFKGAGGGKASRSTQTVVQRIKGSERQIESPLASIINKTQDVVKQGETNKAASILASYKDLEGNPFGLRELKSTETVGTKPTISFLDNGKVRRFETTPEVAAAAKSLNKEQIGILGKIVRIPTRVLRLGATGVNAGFALANIAKDMASAAINTEHPFRASALNPTVLKKATAAAANHGSKSYAELVREGAGGTSFDIARDQPRQNVAKIRAEKNAGTKAMYTVTHPGELLRAVENTIGRSEEFTRAIQYFGNKEAGLKQGLTESEAKRYGAHAARNNTVNFARAGDYGAVLNSALPYLNAGVQGSRTLLRNIKNHPAQTLTKIAVLGALPTATITAWNLSDPDRAAAYKDISEYEKEGNFIIVPPHPTKDEKTGRWNVIKIPVSQELANLNNVVRNTVEQATGQDGSLTAGKVLGDLIGTTTSLSAQDPRQLVGQFVPQALKPAVETLTNQNLFTGNSIVPDSQKNLPAQDQYGNYTSNTAIALGKLTGQSPRVIDDAIKTATGGAGQTAINLADNVLSATGIENTNPVQGKTVGDSISNRFLGASSIPASDKADKAFEDAKKQLINTPEYKALSVQDQAKSLNRLQTDVNAVIYNQEDTANPNSGYTAKPLSANQSKLAQGLKSLTDYTQPSVSSLSNTKLSSTDPSYSFLDDYSAVNTADKNTYLQQPVDTKYQSLVDNINKSLPEDAAQVPATNAVAKLYADFAKNKADNNWSDLQTQTEAAKVAQNAYKSALTPDEQFLSGLSDAKIIDAVNNGQVTKDQLDHIINVDNESIKVGGSQNISNKTRAALGYGTIATSTAKKASTKKASSKYDYAKRLETTASLGKSTTSALRNLVYGSKIKAKKAKA